MEEIFIAIMERIAEKMPVPFPTLPVPGFGYPYHINRTDFLDAYCKSAKILGASRIKNASLDISPVSVILRVQVE